MKRSVVILFALAACAPSAPPEQYGFVARLGKDTVSVERVSRNGNKLTSDEVDRFPRVRQRHTEIELFPNGGIKHLAMDITTPSESENERARHVEVTVTSDAVHITKTDKAGTVQRDFKTGGNVAMAHLPQMYSLYELYFDAALNRLKGQTPGVNDTTSLRQFYIDREFDKFPLHSGFVRVLPNKLEIAHDWLAGVGEGVVDSAGRMTHYSGTRTTYKVEVERVSQLPDVSAIGQQFATTETQGGGFKQLSVRDTARATIGGATFTVDYSRPLVRGRELLGGIIPYDRVWRTGANAATHFTTSAPITIAGLNVPAGAYTLWTMPKKDGVDLIVNKQTGIWGTGYDGSHDLGKGAMKTSANAAPVEEFTITIEPGAQAKRGVMVMTWGPWKWEAPIEVK